ncbi:MAG: hypothetical protein [Wendovervirus sonii]|uniref:Uncharacterized protein n=1 Tax=phage Lak_Megaphage_Sonny TaxID=3109229 RepID=A0ABZ0Z310_9CAUD|nr:MAG: hypothetical protein [phage Lak_Megaphage_Sonny]
MRDEIRFNASKIALETSVRKAIMNKNIPGYGKVIDCKLASNTVDKADKIDIFIKFENDKAFYPANVKTRYEGSENYAIDEENLNNNTFIIYYEKPFSNEYLEVLNISVAPDLMLTNEKIHILISEQIINEIHIKNSPNVKFYQTDKGGYWVLMNDWINHVSIKGIII